jgi:hypothetical protein
MPLAVMVTKAGANDGCQTHKVLAALVVRPPVSEVPTDTPDERGRPTARADGDRLRFVRDRHRPFFEHHRRSVFVTAEADGARPT